MWCFETRELRNPQLKTCHEIDVRYNCWGVEISAFTEMTPGLSNIHSKVGECPVFKTNIQNQLSVEVGDQQCQIDFLMSTTKTSRNGDSTLQAQRKTTETQLSTTNTITDTHQTQRTEKQASTTHIITDTNTITDTDRNEDITTTETLTKPPTTDTTTTQAQDKKSVQDDLNHLKTYFLWTLLIVIYAVANYFQIPMPAIV
ncbi:uncharacterized protein LOC143047105 [Mytilus galloprovincialis]|uniref:uncharacterized protein LOC143047105 n=1 Tax=Mytilus galloprovincialis TaxID=29158 RepID=UPI003F7C624D